MVKSSSSFKTSSIQSIIGAARTLVFENIAAAAKTRLCLQCERCKLRQRGVRQNYEPDPARPKRVCVLVVGSEGLYCVMSSRAFLTGLVMGTAAGVGLAYRQYAWLFGRPKVRGQDPHTDNRCRIPPQFTMWRNLGHARALAAVSRPHISVNMAATQKRLSTGKRYENSHTSFLVVEFQDV